MKRTVPYALITAGVLIAYFFLMKIMGLETNLYLRALNLVIMVGAMFLLYRNTFNDAKARVGYMQGLMMGVLFTVVSVAIFVMFLGIYIHFFDPAFIEIIDGSGLWATSGSSVGQSIFGIMAEGLAAGFVLAFIMMQYFKSKIKPEEQA